MVVLDLIQEQTHLFLTQPLTMIYPLNDSENVLFRKNFVFHMQFFNPFRTSLGLLYLSVFSFCAIIFVFLVFFVPPENVTVEEFCQKTHKKNNNLTESRQRLLNSRARCSFSFFSPSFLLILVKSLPVFCVNTSIIINCFNSGSQLRKLQDY